MLHEILEEEATASEPLPGLNIYLYVHRSTFFSCILLREAIFKQYGVASLLAALTSLLSKGYGVAGSLFYSCTPVMLKYFSSLAIKAV